MRKVMMLPLTGGQRQHDGSKAPAVIVVVPLNDIGREGSSAERKSRTHCWPCIGS
jgi:hypothetical protein